MSKSIEQLRQPSAHLHESEEEEQQQQEEQQRQDEPLAHRQHDESMQEDRVPPGGVIRKHTLSSRSGELPNGHCGVIRVKEEPVDSEDEALESEQRAYLHQVKGRLVIRAMI